LEINEVNFFNSQKKHYLRKITAFLSRPTDQIR
jgi:hypothetical protein